MDGSTLRSTYRGTTAKTCKTRDEENMDNQKDSPPFGEGTLTYREHSAGFTHCPDCEQASPAAWTERRLPSTQAWRGEDNMNDSHKNKLKHLALTTFAHSRWPICDDGQQASPAVRTATTPTGARFRCF